MHLVSPRKQRRLRIQFPQTVFKPRNLSFPFYKTLLPLVAFNPFSCITEIKQTKQHKLWYRESIEKKTRRPYSNCTGRLVLQISGHIHHWQFWHVCTWTLAGASLPCISVLYFIIIPTKNIHLCIRQGSHQHMTFLLFCLVKLTLHGILIIFICNVPPVLYFIWNGNIGHCQDEAEKGQIMQLSK